MPDKNNDMKSLPLKDRKDEILSLAREIIKASEEQLDTGSRVLSREAEEYLLSHDWPGDEDELEIAVKRACILSDGPAIEVDDFDLRHRKATAIGKFVETRLRGFMRNIKRFEEFNLYDMVIPEVEKSLILMVMKETKGNQVRAAKLLGINRNTLRSKIKKLGINVKSR